MAQGITTILGNQIAIITCFFKLKNTIATALCSAGKVTATARGITAVIALLTKVNIAIAAAFKLAGCATTIAICGTVDADINAEQMWAIEDGENSVVIGTIDSGIDYTHNDLIPNLWVNSQEIPSNGMDDDGNGYVDDIYGINSILNNGNPADDNGHGTFAAGIIGARGNNALGVVGVAQDVQIASCKSISASGQGHISDVIQCMQYFANLKNRAVNPVNIVATSNAWTSSTLSSSALLDAIKAHDSLGIIFVAAAGNAGKNNDVAGSVPGNIQQANIISVTATDDTDAVPSFANYGQRLVHVAAPGDSILSTIPGQAYGTKSGTSAAVAHVAGLIAIIKSAFPLYTHYQIKNLVISSGTPLANLDSITVSGRRIRGADSNDQGALTCVDQIVDRRTFPFAQNITISLGESIFLEALRINCDQPIGPLQLYSVGVESVVLQDSGTNGDRTAKTEGLVSYGSHKWRELIILILVMVT